MDGPTGISSSSTQTRVGTPPAQPAWFTHVKAAAAWVLEIEAGPPPFEENRLVRARVVESQAQAQAAPVDGNFSSSIGNDISRFGSWIARKLGFGTPSAESPARTESKASSEPPSKVDRALRQVGDWLKFQGPAINEGPLFVHKFGAKTIAREALVGALQETAKTGLEQVVEVALAALRKVPAYNDEDDRPRQLEALAGLRSALKRLLETHAGVGTDLRRLLVGIEAQVGSSAASAKKPDVILNALVHAGLRPMLDAMIAQTPDFKRKNDLRLLREAAGHVTADAAFKNATRQMSLAPSSSGTPKTGEGAVVPRPQQAGVQFGLRPGMSDSMVSSNQQPPRTQPKVDSGPQIVFGRRIAAPSEPLVATDPERVAVDAVFQSVARRLDQKASLFVKNALLESGGKIDAILVDKLLSEIDQGDAGSAGLATILRAAGEPELAQLLSVAGERSASLLLSTYARHVDALADKQASGNQQDAYRWLARALSGLAGSPLDLRGLPDGSSPMAGEVLKFVLSVQTNQLREMTSVIERSVLRSNRGNAAPGRIQDGKHGAVAVLTPAEFSRQLSEGGSKTEPPADLAPVNFRSGATSEPPALQRPKSIEQPNWHQSEAFQSDTARNRVNAPVTATVGQKSGLDGHPTPPKRESPPREKS